MAWFADPQQAASGFLDQIPAQSRQIYDPYIQRGNVASEQSAQQFGRMSQDPGQFYEQLMQRYKPSRQYEMQNQAQQRAAANTAAAGGMRGTQQDISRAAQIADRLMGEDMQRWYGNVTGLLGQGLQGQQNLGNLGYGASQALGSDLMNVLGQKGGLAYQSAMQENQDTMDLLKALGSIGSFAAGFF